MVVTYAEAQSDLGRFINLTSARDIVITQNDLPVARLLGMKKSGSFLSDRLVGLIPSDVDEGLVKAERLAAR